jgi:phosphohistidine phosphatase
MKTIYLVRHAKSSWGDLTQPDFDRPLNERGQKNAPEMARRLLDKQIQIDAFVTSTAKRALQTASHFIKAYDRNVEQLQLRDELYHAPPTVYREVISGLPDSISSLAIFGHNPGITEFVNSLTTTRIDNMPTCGIFAVQIDSNRWSDFPLARKTFLFFDAPKLG